MRKITWRGVRQHPVRFLLSILAVLLGIAFISGTLSLRAMMASTFDETVDSSMTADVYVNGPETAAEGESSLLGDLGGRQLIPMDLAETIETVPGVERAVPEIQGTMVLVGADGTAVQSGGAPSLAMGIWPDDPAMTIIDGRTPETAGEIALESSSLERSGLAVGDTTKVILNGELTDQKVVGELGFDAPMAGATLAVFDIDTAKELFAANGLVPDIAVTATPGTDAEQLVTDITAALPSDVATDVQTGDTIRQENKDLIADQIGFLQTFLMIFAFIALFVGAFIIFNTFQMVVRQRMREIAVLRAIGASPAQVFGSVVGQAAIVGFVGSTLGVLGGLGLVQLMKVAFSAMGMELSGNIPLTVGGVLLAFGFGIGVAVLAAAMPAVHAARVPPVEAMRDELPTKEHAMLRWGIVGGLLLAGGIGAVVASLQGGDNAGMLLGLGGVGVLFGALAISPVIAPWVVRILVLPFLAIRPLGRLARGNVTRNSVRTSITAGALMVGMALVGGASVMAASTQESMASIVESDLKADFILQGASGEIPVGALKAAAQADGVEEFNPIYLSMLLVDGTKADVGSTPVGFFENSIDPGIQSGSIAEFAAGKAIIRKSFAEANNLALGDTITIENPMLPDTSEDITVGAIFDSASLNISVIVPVDTYEALVPEETRISGQAFVQIEPGADLEQVRDGLTNAVKPYYVVSVLDQDQFASNLADQVNQILNILYALLALSIVVAVIGIINTLALSVMERTREIGMMRAVGLGKLQLAGTITIESILIAVFGAVAGLAVGVGLAAALPSVFADQGLTTLVIPWGTLGTMIGIAALVGIFAALWPAIRAARLPVLESVTYD